MTMVLPMAGDASDGPRPGLENSHLCLPKVALHHVRFPSSGEFVDARAGDEADVYHDPPGVLVRSLPPALFRWRCATAATTRKMSVAEVTSEIAIPVRSVHDS